MPCRCSNVDCIKGLILIHSRVFQGITSLQGHDALIIQLRHSSPAGQAGRQTGKSCSDHDISCGASCIHSDAGRAVSDQA